MTKSIRMTQRLTFYSKQVSGETFCFYIINCFVLTDRQINIVVKVIYCCSKCVNETVS